MHWEGDYFHGDNNDHNTAKCIFCYRPSMETFALIVCVCVCVYIYIYIYRVIQEESA